MNIIFLDYEQEPTNDHSEAFSILKYYYDYLFDKRGVLQIEIHIPSEEITQKFSLVIPRIYDFVKDNETYKVSIGVFNLDQDYIKTFRDVKEFTTEQILTLLEITEGLDNIYQLKQTKKEFLNQ